MVTHPTPDTPPYDLLGGESGVRRIVDRFYDLMDETPEYYVVRKLHPRELGGSRQKLFMFLSGWLGGPQLYVQQYGHPKLRARHLPFAIGNAERNAWIACMTQAMTECDVEESLKNWLLKSLFGTADWMRNSEG